MNKDGKFKSKYFDNKLSYYSINRHRFALWLYAILTLLISVAFFIVILRLLFGAFAFIPSLSIGNTENPDYSYLPDFLGGLIGVVIGFFADSMFISRLQHLKRYKSLLNLLNKELSDVKKIIRNLWGVKELTEKNSLICLLTAIGLINKNEICFDQIEKINLYLEKKGESKEAKEFYINLFNAIKEVFINKQNELTKIRQNIKWIEFDEKINFNDLVAYFQTDHDCGSYNITYLRLALNCCLTLDKSRITKISVPILENIVNSPEWNATFFNLPRYSIWGEEQGNFSHELQYFYHTIDTFESSLKAKDPCEFFAICQDLIDRIGKFQKCTDITYYMPATCDYLIPILNNIGPEKDIIKSLVGEQSYGLQIKKLKEKNFIEKHPIISNSKFFFFLRPIIRTNINKNYIRYKLVLTPTTKQLPGSNVKRKLRGGYLITDNYQILRKSSELKFKKEWFLSPNIISYTFKDLVKRFDYIFETQSALSMELMHEQRISKPHKLSAFAFSSKFFSDNVKKFVTDKSELEATDYLYDECLEDLSKNSKRLESELEKISAVFKDITTIPLSYNYRHAIKLKVIGDLTVLDEKLDEGIYKVIRNSPNKKGIILKLSSPIGSYKNRLLQYIYLKLNIDEHFDNKNIFYIDMSKYEYKYDPVNIINDFAIIKEIIDSNNSKMPLFILDNVRGFHCGINNLYTQFLDFLEKEIKNYKLILGCDKLYTLNPDQQEKLPFEDFISYKTTIVNISSMNISREAESKDFISNCIAFAGDTVDRAKVEEIRSDLMRLNFYTLDAYWLIKILKQTNYLKTDCADILTLYDIGLFKYTSEMGKPQYDELAKSVYAFEYESQHFDTFQLRNNTWTIAREHRSMIDYLVARHYVVILRETILPKDEYTIIQNLGGKLNLILPKSVNRFIVCELSSNDIHNLICFCEQNINIIKKYPKFECQVTYILRLLGKKYAEYFSDSRAILNMMLNHSCPPQKLARLNDAEKRQQLFLYRCIAIGLGYLEDVKEFSKYLNSLVKPATKNTRFNMADDVNRAFHLDYYGDTYKCLDLNGSFANYTDNDNEKGVNALRKLQIDISRDIKIYKELSKGKKAILILQIVTYCSLLKARNYRFKSLSGEENFTGSIIDFIKYLAIEVNNYDLEDEWLNNKDSNIGKYLIDVFDKVLEDNVK